MVFLNQRNASKTKVVAEYIFYSGLEHEIDGMNTKPSCYKPTLPKLLNVISWL